jgi:hypothetical protein
MLTEREFIEHATEMADSGDYASMWDLEAALRERWPQESSTWLSGKVWDFLSERRLAAFLYREW